MKEVLVTGGLGNIGIKVVDELLSRGVQVRCLDLKSKANQKIARRYRKKLKMVWADITDTRSVINATMGVDAVIHTAAILPPFSEQRPQVAEKVNVGGTRNIINALSQFNPSAQMILASSVSVHGNHLPDHDPGRTVSDPYNPIDHYAKHKIECEQMLRESKLNWTVLRISACVDEKARLLSVKNLKGSVETFLRVHPMCRIEYIHPADVATAMVNAVGNQQAMGKQFFLGGGIRCQSNWRDLNSIRLEMLGLEKPPIECFGVEGFYTEWLDTNESQQVLNFQNHDLNDYRKELERLFKWPRRLLIPARPIINRYIWRALSNVSVSAG